MHSGSDDPDFMVLDKARWALTWVWLVGAAIPFVILIIQSVMGKYGTNNGIQRAWAWFLPNVTPTLVLMVGVLGAAAFSRDDNRLVRRDFFSLSRALSLFYLCVLTLTFVLEVLSTIPPDQLMTMSNYWLSPLQSLTAGAIGLLFTSQKAKSPGKR